MADLGAIATTSFNAETVAIGSPFDLSIPPTADYWLGIPVATSAISQALRRWTGTEWEPIQMSYWDGFNWILGEPE